MTEAGILQPALARLRTDGWTVACEVRIASGRADAIAVKGDHIVRVEAKKSLSWNLSYQLSSHSYLFDGFLAVVGGKPKKASLERFCRVQGQALWIAKDGSVAELFPLVIDTSQTCAKAERAKLRAKVLRMQNLSACGGEPCKKGVSHAREVLALVDAYRSEHPKTTWNEMFRVLPNHYASASSMRQSLKTIRYVVEQEKKQERRQGQND